MPSYYIYLISSLAILSFGNKPPFTFERFLEICDKLIPEDDVEIIKKAYRGDIYNYSGNQPTLVRWRAFDMALRNELVKIRGGRKHLQRERYQRQDGAPDIAINHIAINASRSPSILESERMLDEARWRALDELAMGHYFDIDFLILYACKLFILEKWERINTANKANTLQAVLAKG